MLANPLHTVRYMLGRPLRIFGFATNAREEQQQILELLTRVNLAPAAQFIDKYPHELVGVSASASPSPRARRAP